MSIYFTKLSAIADIQDSPAKTYGLNNGKLIKTLGSMDAIYQGEIIGITSMAGFKDKLSEVNPDKAFLYGIPNGQPEEFVAVPTYRRAEISEIVGTEYGPVLTRTRSNFGYAEGQPGIMFIDIDGITGNPDVQVDKIYEAIPELKEYPHVVHPSSSSNIVGPDGKHYSRVKGLHLYWFVDDASRIPEYGQVLFDKLTLAGHSRVDVSKSGALLKRSVIDASVWQPERLDFVGGAVLNDGLTYSNREPVLRGERQDRIQIVPGDVFKPLSQNAKKNLDAVWSRMRSEKRPEAEQVSDAWVDASSSDTERKARQTVVRSRQSGRETILQPGFMLHPSNGSPFDVRDVADLARKDLSAARAKYHGMHIADPDTDESGKAMLYVNARDSIKIHSFKHGGKVFRVISTPVVQQGRATEDAENIADVLRNSGDFFRMDNGGLVRVGNDKLIYYSTMEDDVRVFVRDVSGYLSYQTAKGDADLPMGVAKQFLATVDSFGFPVIEKISRIPGLDKSLWMYGQKAGYHEPSKTYFLKDFSGVTNIKTPGDALAAVGRLLSPFSEYRHPDADKGRAAMLAAVLTSIFRPMLDTAPGIAIHTPMNGQSTGKTPMAEALAAAGGWGFASKGWKDNRENDKVIHAHLWNSGSSALYFDNVNGRFSSSTMAIILTSGIYSARELQKTRDVPVSTNVLMMLSANAYEPDKDMAVRWLEIPLVPQRIARDWMPVDKVDHQAFVSDAFGLVAYVRDNFDKTEIMTSVTNTKFPHWTDVVQYPVMALTGIDPMSRSDERGKDADYEDMFEIMGILDAVWGKTNSEERTSLTAGHFECHAGLSLAEMLTDKHNMKSNRFSAALARYARGRTETHGGETGPYLLECVADRPNDGAKTKLYRLTKPGAVEDASPMKHQTQNTVAGNVVALFDAGTYAEDEIADCDDDLVHQSSVVISDEQRIRLESMVADYGFDDPRGQTAMSILLNEQEMSCAEDEVGYYENILKNAGVRFL